MIIIKKNKINFSAESQKFSLKNKSSGSICSFLGKVRKNSTNGDDGDDDDEKTEKKTFKLGKRTKCCAQFWFMLFFVLLDLSIVGLSSMSYHILVRPPISGDIFNVGVNGVKLEANSYDANQKFDSIHPTISPILTEFLVPAMLLLAAVFGSMILLYRVVFVYSVIYPDTIENNQTSENVKTDENAKIVPTYRRDLLLNNQDIKLRF